MNTKSNYDYSYLNFENTDEETIKENYFQDFISALLATSETQSTQKEESKIKSYKLLLKLGKEEGKFEGLEDHYKTSPTSTPHAQREQWKNEFFDLFMRIVNYSKLSKEQKAQAKDNFQRVETPLLLQSILPILQSGEVALSGKLQIRKKESTAKKLLKRINKKFLLVVGTAFTVGSASAWYFKDRTPTVPASGHQIQPSHLPKQDIASTLSTMNNKVGNILNSKQKTNYSKMIAALNTITDEELKNIEQHIAHRYGINDSQANVEKFGETFRSMNKNEFGFSTGILGLRAVVKGSFGSNIFAQDSVESSDIKKQALQMYTRLFHAADHLFNYEYSQTDNIAFDQSTSSLLRKVYSGSSLTQEERQAFFQLLLEVCEAGDGNFTQHANGHAYPKNVQRHIADLHSDIKKIF